MASTRELATGDRSLRAHAARGTLVNGAFDVGVGLLGLVRGFVVAAFLSASDYGVWGIVVVAFGTLGWLKQAGVGEKYVQQDEPDQELAFQRAFTIELLANAAFLVVLLAAIPLAVALYGQSRIVGPALALAAVVPAYVLQAPAWVLYRRMEFVRQRSLQATDAVVSFAVTVALAAAGAGYWAFVGGLLAGAWAAAIAIARSSPYPLRWRFHRATLRGYTAFSWPLLAAGAAGVLVAQGTTIAASRGLGLAAVGAIALATTIGQFVDRVDTMVSATLYPAVCAVAGRAELLRETFVKANRLALMWGVPFGAGVALFAGDAVHHGIGARWGFAVELIRLTALAALLNHVAFNWHLYFRALGRTRPLALAAAANVAAFAAGPVPLLLAFGLEGYGWGLIGAAAVQVALRAVLLDRLFGGFSMVRHTARALAPSAVPVGAVLLWRLAGPLPRTGWEALGEGLAYLVLTAGATALLERDLLREVAGYLRRSAPPPGAAAPAPA